MKIPTSLLRIDLDTRKPSSTELRNREKWSILLEEISRYGSGNTEAKKVLSAYIAAKGIKPSAFSPSKVRLCYNFFTSVLNEHYDEKEVRISEMEDLFDKLMVHYNRRERRYLKQVWIGPHNVDFFIPWTRTKLGLGTIVEIGGRYYDKALKKKMFKQKVKYIQEKFKTPVKFFYKDEVGGELVKGLIDDAQYQRPLSASEKSRLCSKIWIDTIAAWIDQRPLSEERDSILECCFGGSYKDLKQLRDQMISVKKTKRL